MEAFVYCWTDHGTSKLYIGAHRGIPRSEETKEKLRMASLGNKNCLGRKATEETKHRMRESWIIRKTKQKDSV